MKPKKILFGCVVVDINRNILKGVGYLGSPDLEECEKRINTVLTW